jgi:phage baseplate assembly protein W
MATNTRLFSDLDLNFKPHPISKDVSKRINDNAIKSSLRNLLQTSYYERPFHSEIGSPLRQLLFEMAGPFNREIIKRAVEDTINNFEPRVSLTNVEVRYTPDQNTVEITIEYRILNSSTPQLLQLALERTR